MTKTKQDKKIRCGTVAIVGRPNVGKSTLLNAIVKEKVAIVSKIPQTTRQQIRGIYNDERGQIIFVDTPGLHAGRDKLDRFMRKSAYGVTQQAECIIHLVDSSRSVGREEEQIVENLGALKVPIVLGLNKIDLKGERVAQYLELWERLKGVPVQKIKNFTLIALSGLQGKNIDELLDVLFGVLPEGPRLYPEDALTDTPQRMAIADIIREKLLGVLRQEVPHSVAVVIENTQPRRKKTIYIQALILVERDSQKTIVIGKNAKLLKEIGQQARLELENLLESKVFLELRVKTKKDWRDNDELLLEMGYHQ